MSKKWRILEIVEADTEKFEQLQVAILKNLPCNLKTIQRSGVVELSCEKVKNDGWL
jgi:hypothetical protein